MGRKNPRVYFILNLLTTDLFLKSLSDELLGYSEEVFVTQFRLLFPRQHRGRKGDKIVIRKETELNEGGEDVEQ